MEKRHCQEDGWLCEPGTRCEAHRDDPVLVAEYMAGFSAGYQQGWREGFAVRPELPVGSVDE